MTPRQFAIVTLLFGAGLLSASVARPGNWEAVGSSPVTATVAPRVGPPAAALPAPSAATAEPSIRVVLPSPYEER
jgi:hypothetical protein